MYSYAGKVDIGVYEHQNDDRLLIGSHILTSGEYSDKTDNSFIIATICDGVGGLAQGYRAAMITLEAISHLNRAGVNEDEIQKTVELANKRIRNIQSIENLQDGLRTTVAGIYADKDVFLVFNAGDSRVYRFRYRFLNQLSKDHSLVQDMIDMGKISTEEAKNHPKKNIINKCIGNEERINTRIVNLSDDFEDGDIIMICSDGITDEVLDAEIKSIIFDHSEDDDLLECCKAICNKAIEKGSKDNMSIILLRKDN